MKKILRIILYVALAAFLFCGCGNSTNETVAFEDVPSVAEPVEALDTEKKEADDRTFTNLSQNIKKHCYQLSVMKIRDIIAVIEYPAIQNLKILWKSGIRFILILKMKKFYLLAIFMHLVSNN